MAKGKDQHVVSRKDGWGVRGEGNKRDTSHHRTQKDAIDSARDIAKNQKAEVVIHGRDGKMVRIVPIGIRVAPKDRKH